MADDERKPLTTIMRLAVVGAVVVFVCCPDKNSARNSFGTSSRMYRYYKILVLSERIVATSQKG